ncbi:MAG: C4-type zinc ribbon domain-containing protein [Bacteroidota bacterium]
MSNTIKEKLTWLLELQDIDKQLGEIVEMRGALPDEIKALVGELASIQTQLQQNQENIASLEQAITTQRVRIKDISQLVQRYKEQQMSVRSNREYDTLTKEIELQELDSQLLERKIKAHYEQIEKNKSTMEQVSAAVKKKKQTLADRQQRLELVVKESQEESNLHKQRAWLIESLDKDLLQYYEKVRKNVGNNPAIAVIEKEACSGCFIVVCPQVQAMVRKKEELVNCEHCGRILADVVGHIITEENTIEKQQRVEA